MPDLHPVAPARRTELPLEPDLTPDDSWDAGDLGCGELVVDLFLRLRALDPGKLFLLTATDPGARHDIPAWCRLTGHRLVVDQPPRFLIRRKD